MRSSGSNGQIEALKSAQESIEAVLSAFEHEVFTHESDGIKVGVFGTMRIESITPASGDFEVTTFKKVYDAAIESLEYSKSVKLAAIRNQVKAKFHFDLSTQIPEVKKAVDYLNARQANQ